MADYFNRKSLNEMGIRQSLDDLSDFEVNYLTFIHNEFKAEENRRVKLKKK